MCSTRREQAEINASCASITAKDVRVPLHVPRAMGLTLSFFAFATLAPLAKADPAKPVRVIPITKENAERSAAAMSAAKSPFIGAPPPGRIVRTPSDWRNSRAQSLDNTADAAPQVERADRPAPDLHEDAADRAMVRIIKGSKTGLVVETRIVPRHNSSRGLREKASNQRAPLHFRNRNSAIIPQATATHATQ